MNLKNILATGAIAISLGAVETGLLYVEPLEKQWWYDDAWEMTEEYTGEVVEQPKYFLIKLRSFPCPPNFQELLRPFKEKCYGLYIPYGPIFLTEDDIDDMDSVLHEMLHAHYVFDEEGIESGLKRIKSDLRFAPTLTKIKAAN